MRRATASAGARSCGRRRGPVRRLPRAENRKLQRVPLALALRTRNLLARGHHDALIARLAIIANVFVSRHPAHPPIKVLPQAIISIIRQSKFSAITHKIERIRVLLLPRVARRRKAGAVATTSLVKDLHLATHAQPNRSTSHGIITKATKQMTKRPETERIAVHSSAALHRGACVG